jgi:transglutaminase-like putative cysteine protease
LVKGKTTHNPMKVDSTPETRTACGLSAHYGFASSWVATFAQDLANACDHELLATLMVLCRTVCSDFQYEKRPSGPPHKPAQTLVEHKGSCRDFVVLAMAACRQLGLACRYVSGYHLSYAAEEPGELHAWMEVFLPGAGWRGFDPTHGMACDHHHLALSASSDPALTLPVTGSFRGRTSCRMQVELALQY